MDRFAVPSPLGGGTALSTSRTTGRWVLGLLILVLVASLFAIPAHGPGATGVPYPHASAAVPAAPRAAAVTH
ncbi:MAG: hypothetical protein L3K05_08470, partial [Thermoplasmata archaeon]|nr:hypothetical protein [Thermoplasmata archaeon]